MSTEDNTPVVDSEIVDPVDINDNVSEDSESNYVERDDDLQELPSMCMNCGGTGMTRMLMHEIPYFRKLFIASFYCEECDESNNEVTFGGEIQLQGCVITYKACTAADLDRQIIKSDAASLKIVEIDFEIPPKSQKGGITTIEGVLKTASANLLICQNDRMEQMPEVGAKVQKIIDALDDMSRGAKLPFTIVINDPSGNSFIENPAAPAKDPHMTTKFYFRSADQDISLGLQPDKGVFKDDKDSNFKALMFGEFGSDKKEVVVAEEVKEVVIVETDAGVQLGRNEIISLPSHCPNCAYLGENLTCVADIPHFKEVIIMSFDCSQCGFRNNEVKGGGAIPTLGTEVKLLVTSLDDLKRDVLKSDSSGVSIPELELELECGTLGGMYTTVEGLLGKIHKKLSEQHGYQLGDSKWNNHSEDTSFKNDSFGTFLARLMALMKGENFPFTLILHDPLGNSFISAPLGSFLSLEEDTALSLADFERSEEENDDFGLSTMNTADYEVVPEHVTASANDIVYADRLTRVVKKGADHPSFFAKGCEENDNTTGGAYVPTTAPVTASVQETTSALPAGWKACKQNENGDFEDVEDDE